MRRRLAPILLATLFALLPDARAELPASESGSERTRSPAPPPPVPPRVEPGPLPVREHPGRRIPPPEPPVPIGIEGANHSGWGGFLSGFGPHVRRSLESARWVPRRQASEAGPGPRPPGREGDGSALGRPSTPRADGAGASGLPTRLALGPATPNPTAGAVALRLELPARASVGFVVLDVSGRIVHERVETFAAGRHLLSWSGREHRGGVVRPGIYFLRVSVDGRTLGTRRWAVIP